MEQMDYFLSQLFQPSDLTLFSLADVLLALAVTTILCFMLAHVYRVTHRGTSYSQSFLVTLFLMGAATSIVMIIIGSNIARAFSLVGALSIIRFRTAVKDSRDTGFLFVAIIAGMGCGTGFYLPAIILTVFVCALLLLLHYFDFGVKQSLESILRVTYTEGSDAPAEIEAQLEKTCREHRLLNRILDFGDGHVTNVYVVRPGRNTDFSALEEGLRGVEGVAQLSVYETDQHAPL
jgi:uncharacterized membrane protein YhiD involved in acid resistance